MPIPTAGNKTLTEILNEQKQYTNEEFFNSIFFEGGEGKLDDFYNKCSTIYDKIVGQLQAVRDIKDRNAGVLKTVNDLTAEDKNALAEEGIKESDIPKWAAINYDIKKIGTNAANMSVKLWYDELIVNKGTQMAKMLARRLQLDFLEELRASIPEGIDMTFEVTEGTGFMGRTLKYRPIEFIIAEADDGSKMTKTIELDNIDKAASAMSLEDAPGDEDGFNKPQVDIDAFVKELTNAIEIVSSKDFDIKTIPQGTREGTITIENIKAEEVSQRLLDNGYNTYIANFANALRPGGGVVQGASAQEESLFHFFVNLFPHLALAKDYYDGNKEILEEIAFTEKELRRAAKILAKRDIVAQIADGKFAQEFQEQAKELIKKKNDDEISKFLVDLRVDETKEDLAKLKEIAENADGNYDIEFQERANDILEPESDEQEGNKAKRMKYDPEFLEKASDEQGDKIKKMKKEMEILYKDMGIEVEHSVDISKKIEDLIEEKISNEEEKVKALSLELAKKYGLPQVMAISQSVEVSTEPGGDPTVLDSGLIFINAPDLRNVVNNVDNKIANMLVAFEEAHTDDSGMRYFSKEEREKKLVEFTNKALEDSQAEINAIVSKHLYGQIGTGLELVIKRMKEDQKYAVVLGAVGCGVFKCDPNVVAGVFKDLLIDNGLRNHFDKIVFAIFEPNGNRFGDTFRSVLQV